MNARFMAHRLINVYKQDLRLFRQIPRLFPRYVTTNIQPQLATNTRRWAIKQYVLIIGLPLTSVLFYRLTTKYDTRRKHVIVLGSIGRAIR
jgi:hypothetical protein